LVISLTLVNVVDFEQLDNNNPQAELARSATEHGAISFNNILLFELFFS
jgi:hypothetical protein